MGDDAAPCVSCSTGGPDEVSRTGVELFSPGGRCSALGQRGRLEGGTDGTEVDLLRWAYSLRTSEVCFSQLPFAGFKEGTLYLPSLN